MRVEEFSTGYYLAQVFVEPGSERPRINSHDYQDLQKAVHETGGKEQEVLFQCDGFAFPVEPSRSLPTDTLKLPEEAIGKVNIANPPSRKIVRVPKAWMHRFLKVPDIALNEVL